jgi:hypothetical protein
MTPEQILRVREQYASGVTLNEIQRDNNINRATLYTCIAGGPMMDTGKRMFDAMPLRSLVSRGWATERTRKQLRAKLVSSLWQSAEAQLRESEGRSDLDSAGSIERARDARTIAVLARTLRDLDTSRPRKKKTPDTSGEDAGAEAKVNHDDPRQIDDFRRELARRIEAIASGSDPETGGGT